MELKRRECRECHGVGHFSEEVGEDETWYDDCEVCDGVGMLYPCPSCQGMQFKSSTCGYCKGGRYVSLSERDYIASEIAHEERRLARLAAAEAEELRKAKEGTDRRSRVQQRYGLDPIPMEA